MKVKVRCVNCQHVQYADDMEIEVECENCGWTIVLEYDKEA